jgi:hypothetical protein
LDEKLHGGNLLSADEERRWGCGQILFVSLTDW